MAGIYKKIQAVQKEVGSIPKNGVGPAQKGGFAFLRSDDLLEGVRKQYVKHGIITQMETLEHVVNAREVNNRTVINTNVLVRYTLIDPDDGSSLVYSVGGEGSDIGADTATRKSYTQAQKVFLLHAFNVVSGEDVDSDSHAPIELPDPAKVEQKGPTKAEQAKQAKADDALSIRTEIGQRFINNPDVPQYDSGTVNALAKKITGKEPNGAAGWGFNIPDLKKVLAALEAGEVA